MRRTLAATVLLALLAGAFGTPSRGRAAHLRPSGKVPRLVRAALPALRAARFPVLVPARDFDGVDLERGSHAYVRAMANAHHYEIEIDVTPACNGANVCSAGHFGAADAAYRRQAGYDRKADPFAVRPHAPDAAERADIARGMAIVDRPVRLVDGGIGYYSEIHSGGGGGGTSALRFARDGVVYLIGTRISNQASLVRIANRALALGAISP
jgi:hypothetical protein